ncbi:SGNH/GDSL hydrolase family protein [Priestia megaterium]|uniref:SGNH/GDSL hydrolase family protein n=1 Tax=Priestia megaterium TaxID=1404 RepID=UPI00345B4916
MKIALLGDSITEGIGSKKINYAKYLQDKIPNATVMNFALTGTTISYGLSKLDDILEFNPDIVIVFYGNVDAMPRLIENTLYYKILPERYKGLGMLEPRALFTRKRIKRFFQRLDSGFRYRLKNTLVKNFGYNQWTKIEEFENTYSLLLEGLGLNECKVIAVSTVPMCDKLFPYANIEYQKYNKVIENLSFRYSCEFLNLYEYLKRYDKKLIFLEDLFHPSDKGYDVIGQLLHEKITKASREIMDG